jgi:hypothetical protein
MLAAATLMDPSALATKGLADREASVTAGRCAGNVECDALCRERRVPGVKTPEGVDTAGSSQAFRTAQSSATNSLPTPPEDTEVEFAMNPLFPEMPSSVPLTYTLMLHACLSVGPSDRPTAAQVRLLAQNACHACI